MNTSWRRQPSVERSFTRRSPARPTNGRPCWSSVWPGSLADEHDLGVGVALARHGARSGLREAAVRADANLGGDRLERGASRLRGRRAVDWFARGLARASRGRLDQRLAPRSRPHPAPLDEGLGQLHGVRRRALAQVVRDDPEREPRPSGIDGSWRTRPTNTSSRPAASLASGYSCVAGSSWTTTPGTPPNSRRARSGVIGSLVSTWTASEWLTNTGTRTAVHEIRRSGRWRIFRLSVTIFHSSFV